MLISLKIPFPPSENGCFATNWQTKRRFRTKAYNTWKEKAGWTIKGQRGNKYISGPYSVEIVLVRPDKRRRDCPNYIKPVLDLLVELCVTPDDSECQECLVKWAPEGPPAMVHVFEHKDRKGLP